MITGTYPPEICGAGDYTQKILHTQNSKKWKLYYPQIWSIRSLYEKIREINSLNIDVINLQYPTMGYKRSFLPHILCVYYSVFTHKSFSVTIHEYTQLSIKAKTAAFFLLLFSNKLIFTNQFELESAAKTVPNLKRKSTIIKIYTNIESAPNLKKIEERKYDLIYFGLIRPNKGIENFIDVAGKLKQTHPLLKVIVVGKTQPEHIEYAESQVKYLEQYKIETIFNKEEKIVSSLIADTKISYLPFPDGISERRGSALAILKNGGLLVTTKGKFTTKGFETCCSFASNNEIAVKTIEDLFLKNDSDFYREKQLNIKKFIETELPNSWEDVSIQYTKFLCQ